jgi:hypothetical protein
MTDTNFNACIDRLLSTVFTNDYPGTFELASSAPSGDYTSEISNIFADTRTDGTTVNYSIFKRRTMTAPTTVRSIAIKRDDASSKPDNFDGLQEMTDDEISETFGERAKTRISASLIGTYQLRSSADGVPTDAGTWVAKGTATDTRQEKGDVDYTRNSTITSIDSFAGDYIGDFTGNYLGEYAQDFVGDFTGNFAGNYIGAENYSSGSEQYTGTYTRTSIGPDAFVSGQDNDYTGNFTGNYIGPINYVGIADYASTSTRNSTDTYTGNYSSTSTRNSTDDFVGNYGQDYVGDYIGNYAGSTILATNETIETYTLYVRTA